MNLHLQIDILIDRCDKTSAWWAWGVDCDRNSKATITRRIWVPVNWAVIHSRVERSEETELKLVLYFP